MPEILEERACKHPAEDCGQVPQLKQKKSEINIQIIYSYFFSYILFLKKTVLTDF